MRRESLDELATDLYHHVFEVLDNYFPSHEMTGPEAGRIATLTERAFQQALYKHFDLTIPTSRRFKSTQS